MIKNIFLESLSNTLLVLQMLKTLFKITTKRTLSIITSKCFQSSKHCLTRKLTIISFKCAFIQMLPKFKIFSNKRTSYHLPKNGLLDFVHPRVFKFARYYQVQTIGRRYITLYYRKKEGISPFII